MAQWHLTFAWLWILFGFASGAITGLFFHRDDWLGGYTSWPRRMIRLGHISFLGLALINLAYATTLRGFPEFTGNLWTSRLLIAGTLLMPTVCYLSAWKRIFRHLFFLPVLSLVLGVGIFLFGEVLK